MAESVEQHEGQMEDKPKSKLPFIIGGFVLLLGIVAAVALMVMGGGESEVNPLHPTPKKEGISITFPDPFTVNLAPPDDQYLATAEVTLEVVPKGEAESAEVTGEIGVGGEGEGEGGGEGGGNKSAHIKQIITEVLQTKSRAQVTSATGRDKIRTQIKSDVNKVLEHGEVVEVYLTILIP